MKNKQMRITIDGPSNTGKTMLAWKIAEFLKLSGVAEENITFFNDNATQLDDPIEVERMLNSALSGGMWQHTDFAFVERIVAPSHSAMGETWAAKPEHYSPVFRSQSHINNEMGRTPAHYATAPLDREYVNTWEKPVSVMKLNEEESERFILGMDTPAPPTEALKSAMERLNLRPATKNAFIARLNAGAVALNSAANLLTHKPVLDMIADADGRKEGNEVRDEILDTFVGLGALRVIDAGPFSKVDPLMRFGGINRIMADPELKARVIEYLEQSSPFDLESSFDPSKAVPVDGTVHSDSDVSQSLATMLVFADQMAGLKNQAVHCGTVLGTPLGQNNGDHNGELETGYKYQRQIHPVTGETRDQMLVRAQPFIKAVTVREHVLLDYSDLPRDLVFDQQCGVRWQTEEELARIGMRYPNVLEFKHQGVRLMPNLTEPTTQPGLRMKDEYKFPVYPREQVVRGAEGEVLKTWVPTPRGMNRVFASIDDQAFIERPDHPLDPLLDVVFTPPDSSFQTTPEMEARRALRNTLLSEQLSNAATNLSKIADVSSSGQVELPKADE